MMKRFNRVKSLIKKGLRMSQFDHADASNDNSQRTADHWSENTAESEAFADNTYWLAIPPVQRRH